MSTIETVLSVVQQHAAVQPERTAVTDGERSLTYAELNAAVAVVSTRLAHHCELAARDTREPVGLLVGQGVDAVVALLSGWRAGLIAVPLDPTSPPSAVHELLAHAGCQVVVATDDHVAVIPAGVEVIDPASSAADLDGASTALEADGPATIYYTSGTTGQPKGLVVTHAQQLAGVRSWCAAYDLRREDRVAMLFHHSFGASRVSLLGPLVGGAELHVYDPRSTGIIALAGALERDRITFAHASPSLLRTVLDQLPEADGLPDLRVFVTGAEGITAHDVARFRRRLRSSCTLVYSYAISEAGPVTALVLDASAEVDGTHLPIGHPLPGKQVRVAEPAGTGVGEIVVGGVGLAAAYWRDPERTADRFRVAADGCPEFYTGDLGRIRPDGQLEFHGRLGTVAKLRGYTIETGLVERAILAFAPTDEVAVVVDERSRPRLVAFVVPDESGESIDIPLLRADLGSRLPHFMVPSAVVLVDALPRTTRGKLAVDQLPPPSHERPELSSAFIPPSDDVERAVIKVWERVLDVAPIGADDDFFELGGDSLAAAESMAALSTEHGIDVPMGAFLESATAASIARVVREGSSAPVAASLVSLRTEGTRPPFVCVHGAHGNILNLRTFAERIGPDQPFAAFQLTPHSLRHSMRSVESLAEDYLGHLRQHFPGEQVVLGGYSFGGVVAFEMARRIAAEGGAGIEVPLVVLLDTASPELGRSRRRRHITTVRRWRADVLMEIRGFVWHRLGIRRSLQTNHLTKRAVRRYDPVPYGGRVLLVRASTAGSTIDDQTGVGWERLAPDGLEIIDVAGAHRLMLEAPVVDDVVRLVRDATDRAIS